MPNAVSAYPPTSIWSLRRAPRDPLAFLRSVAAGGDLVPFSLGGHPAFLLNHPDYVEDVLVLNHAKFSKPDAVRRSGLLGTGLLTAEGGLHRRRRRAAQPAFSPDRLEGYAATITRSAHRAQQGWSEGAVVDMAAEMNALTLSIIGQILFGADLLPRAAEVRRALAVASASIDPLFSLLAPTRRVRPARDLLYALLERLIAERLASADKGDDMLTLLLRDDDDGGPCAGDQLRDDVLTLFIAGHDTIANGLTWTWLLLARHPEVESRLRGELRSTLDGQLPTFKHLKDLPYSGWVLAESLRLYPPSWLLTRRALEEHSIDGVTIPAGAIVVLSQYLLHRDPRFFARPLDFDPDRWGADSSQTRPRLAYFPFGAGPRSCIGQGLATMEGVLLLAALADRWRFGTTASIQCDPRATLRARPPVHMKLIASG